MEKIPIGRMTYADLLEKSRVWAGLCELVQEGNSWKSIYRLEEAGFDLYSRLQKMALEAFVDWKDRELHAELTNLRDRGFLSDASPKTRKLVEKEQLCLMEGYSRRMVDLDLKMDLPNIKRQMQQELENREVSDSMAMER